jgi:hypothetical protein
LHCDGIVYNIFRQKPEDDLRINIKKYKHLKYFVTGKLEIPTQRSDNIKMDLNK